VVARYCLAGLAAVAARKNQAKRAVTLWGAAEGFEETYGLPMIAEERARYERILGPLLFDPALRTARTTGHELDEQDAITYAPASGA
jgi:hypothetical protein